MACSHYFLPAVYYGLIPIPVLVIIALVYGLTLNFIIIFTSSAKYFIQAEKGACSGTDILLNFIYVLNGKLGSEERTILKVTFYYFYYSAIFILNLIFIDKFFYLNLFI